MISGDLRIALVNLLSPVFGRQDWIWMKHVGCLRVVVHGSRALTGGCGCTFELNKCDKAENGIQGVLFLLCRCNKETSGPW